MTQTGPHYVYDSFEKINPSISSHTNTIQYSHPIQLEHSQCNRTYLQESSPFNSFFQTSQQESIPSFVNFSEQMEYSLINNVEHSINKNVSSNINLNTNSIKYPKQVQFHPVTSSEKYFQHQGQLDSKYYDESHLQYDLALKQLEHRVSESMNIKQQIRDRKRRLIFHENKNTKDMYSDFSRNHDKIFLDVNETNIKNKYKINNFKKKFKYLNEPKVECMEMQNDVNTSDDDEHTTSNKFSTLIFEGRRSPPPENTDFLKKLFDKRSQLSVNVSRSNHHAINKTNMLLSTKNSQHRPLTVKFKDTVDLIPSETDDKTEENMDIV